MRMLFRITLAIFMLILISRDQPVKAQAENPNHHLFGLHFGYNKSQPPVANYSVGLRYDWQKNRRQNLGFRFQYILPQERESRVVLESIRPQQYPDTTVATGVTLKGIQFQFLHKVNFAIRDDKPYRFYFFYGPSANIFLYEEYAKVFDESRYWPPFPKDWFGGSTRKKEEETGLAAHIGLGFNLALKNGLHWFSELEGSYSLLTLDVEFFGQEGTRIPHYLSLKTGFRFEAGFGKRDKR